MKAMMRRPGIADAIRMVLLLVRGEEETRLRTEHGAFAKPYLTEGIGMRWNAAWRKEVLEQDERDSGILGRKWS